MASELVKTDTILKIGQRAEFYLSAGNEKYKSRVEDIQDGKLVVAMPVDEKHRPIIPMTGESLYGRLMGQGCQYRFFSTYLGKEVQPIPVWIISKPPTVERMQSRMFNRVHARLLVKVQPVREDGSLEDIVLAQTQNLSGGGVLFTLANPLKVGSKAALEFNDLPSIGTMQTLSQIVRCDLNEETKVYEIGAVFLDLPRSILNRLVRYVFSIERQELAKGVRIKTE